MAHQIASAEANAADKHQPQNYEQQSAPAQREFSVLRGLGFLYLFVVKDSPHAPS
jgi:hypothetical protein